MCRGTGQIFEGHEKNGNFSDFLLDFVSPEHTFLQKNWPSAMFKSHYSLYLVLYYPVFVIFEANFIILARLADDYLFRKIILPFSIIICY